MFTNTFLSINDLSKYLGIKPKTLYSWVTKVILPHYRIGGLIRFKKKDIDQWVEACKRNGVDISNLKVRELRMIISFDTIPLTDKRKPDLRSASITKEVVYGSL